MSSRARIGVPSGREEPPFEALPRTQWPKRNHAHIRSPNSIFLARKMVTLYRSSDSDRLRETSSHTLYITCCTPYATGRIFVLFRREPRGNDAFDQKPVALPNDTTRQRSDGAVGARSNIRRDSTRYNGVMMMGSTHTLKRFRHVVGNRATFAPRA